MPRYFLEVAYMGTRYSGFQIQENAATIQSEVEKALAIKFRHPFSLTGASRTDTGVHSLQNYFHFDSEQPLFETESKLPAGEQLKQLLYSLNSLLPWDIVVKNLFEVSPEAHCRFDAVSREYRYYLYQDKDPFLSQRAYFFPYKVQVAPMQEAAAIIGQTKDFASFSKRNTQVNDFNCKLFKSEWVMQGNLLVYHVAGNRFLRGMVRGLVGTMLRVGTGKLTLENFQAVIESQDCRNADFSVPGHGLFLQEVRYCEDILKPGGGQNQDGAVR
jgi:tRNA pseudouridine38-40 synthase